MGGDDATWPAWATEAVVLVDADPRWAARGRDECDALDQLLDS